MTTLKTAKVFDLSITTDSKENILKYLLEKLENSTDKVKIFTPNPEILMYARKHPEFRKMLNEADINLPDGVGLLLASKLLGIDLNSRITGTDFLETICKVISERSLEKNRIKKGLYSKKSSISGNIKNAYSVGFFGGRGNVAKKTAECLQKKYSGLEVLYADSEWNQTKLKGKNIDILFVAMGCPLQEKWISENLNKIPVNIAMGVGGAFDFISGNVPRAPMFLRTIGLEWLFRLIVQPWRVKRQLQLVLFGLLVLSEFFQVRIFGKKA